MTSAGAAPGPAPAREPGPAAQPGDGVRRLAQVMDTLRSPGGCPWDAEQTHESLVPFVLEEAHELAEAIEADDRAGIREELGDVLLQVVFHARLAQEHETDPFDLDDVADALTAKLVRRHPHVFAAPDGGAGDDGAAGTVRDAESAPAPGGAEGRASDAVHVRWEQIKRAEKNRTSVLEGIPLGQGALARAEKVLSRARRAGLTVDVDRVARAHVAAAPAQRLASAEVGARLLRLVAEAASAGVDAEAALRAALRSLDSAVREAESG